MSTDKVRLSIDCFPEERQKIKVLSALGDLTISEWVMECVREKFKKRSAHTPNKATKKSLKESEEGKGVKTYGSVEELFSELEL